jgi:hypothetical protein
MGVRGRARFVRIAAGLGTLLIAAKVFTVLSTSSLHGSLGIGDEQ